MTELIIGTLVAALIGLPITIKFDQWKKEMEADHEHKNLK